jgi:hypothetical protein
MSFKLALFFSYRNIQSNASDRESASYSNLFMAWKCTLSFFLPPLLLWISSTAALYPSFYSNISYINALLGETFYIAIRIVSAAPSFEDSFKLSHQQKLVVIAVIFKVLSHAVAHKHFLDLILSKNCYPQQMKGFVLLHKSHLIPLMCSMKSIIVRFTSNLFYVF